jgi:V-type H+-transporting ATPase subunit a
LRSLDDQIKRLGVEDTGAHTFGDVFVHQMIETIEFALGTVSNTASYLRLWALSLAHQQLAETFMNLIFKDFVFAQSGTGGTIIMALIFWPALWTVSFGVLMCMDLLECFLHTIRLHWVEFQNKFFKGDGYKFAPYSYSKILQEVLDKE